MNEVKGPPNEAKCPTSVVEAKKPDSIQSNGSVKNNNSSDNNDNSNKMEVSTENDKGIPSTKPAVGIIYPPPEVRNIVDKTASFVARNGAEFEARIRQNEINNPKFNFLNPGDPYHVYYQHKVKELKDGKIASQDAPPGTVSKPLPLPPKQQEILQVHEQKVILKEAPPDYEFITEAPSISAFDLDVVKLTAQFVARNGRQFLTNLMNREQRNYQFDFLRPQHTLFNHFTKLLEQYTKVLIPPKDLMNKLEKEATNPKAILEQLKYRVEWTRLQEAQKRREEEETERERVAYAQVDWHDFVIVEIVDYQQHEQGNFPPPTTPDEVGTRVLAQERFDDAGQDVEMDMSDQEMSDWEEDIPGVTPNNQDDNKVQDMDEDSSDEEKGKRGNSGQKKRPQVPLSPPPQPPAEEAPKPPPLPPLPEQVVIRKDYDPKAQKPIRQHKPDEFLISPITGEKIPANKVQEHMRIGLLDPRWVEQRDRTMNEKLHQEEVYAGGSAIESSLKQLAERRTDIFGFGDEETAIGKKIGEEEKKRDEKVTWDGHTASMEAATRAARANITIEDQIHQIHKVKGLLPDEEKERIGPAKPNINAQSNQVTIVAPPTTNTAAKSSASAPPLPPHPPPPVTPVPPPPCIPSSTPLPPMMPQPVMTPQGMMMVPPRPPVRLPHIRPPPLMSMPHHPHMPPGHPIPPQMPPFQQMPPVPSIPMPSMRPPLPAEEEPLTKKMKTEETLIPEAEFLSKHKGPVTFKIQLPSLNDKPEWKLNGQTLTFTLPLTDMISVVKAKIYEEIGMPPGKQKIQLEGIFFKDSNTLAYYNILPNTTVHLQLKERGGRKK